MHSLKPTGLPPLSSPEPVHEVDQLQRGVEGVVGRRRHDRLADLHAASPGHLRVDLGSGQQPAESGLRSLRDLDRDGLDLVELGSLGELVRVEVAVGSAATEVRRGDLPDEVATVLAVVLADRPLPGVVCEAALRGATVERLDRIGRQRAEAHRRDVEQRDVVRLRALGPAEPNARQYVVWLRLGSQRVRDELVADRRDVALGAERLLAVVALRAVVDEVARLPVVRPPLGVRLDEVLPDLRADLLEEEPEVAEHGVVAGDAVAALHHVVDADQRDEDERRRDEPPAHMDEREQGGQHGHDDQTGDRDPPDHVLMLPRRAPLRGRCASPAPSRNRSARRGSRRSAPAAGR